MPRPHRYVAPRPGRPLVRRSALLRRVQGRWQHPVTVIVGGAGFGKSSLLVQACDENRFAPRGDDCWLGCDPGDTDPRTFARGIATALGADGARLPEAAGDDPEVLAAPLADAMWARSPRQVCLVLDDLHEVGRGPASDVLTALIDALPGNGHLVLSSRFEPPVPLARLVAQGRVLRIDEDDLAFGDEDLAAFASLRSVPVGRLDDVGGWPALVELRTAAAATSVDDFLGEEVLAALGPLDARLAAVVTTLGGADQELFDAVVGPGTDLAAALGKVPLVSADAHGWFTVHDLWVDRLAGVLDDAERREVRRKGGRALAGRDLARGVDLLVAAAADDDLRAVLRTECRAQDLTSSADDLGLVHSRLPPAVRAAPEGELVAGLADTATDLDRAARLLTSAADRFAAAGEDTGLLCAVEHLALCAHWRQDPSLMTDLWAWAERLAAVPEASGLLAVGEALVADTRGDAAAVLATLDAIDPGSLGPSWRVAVDWLRASAELALGYAVPARRHAEAAVASTGATLRGALSMLVVNARTQAGDLDAAGAALAQVLDDLARSGNDHNRALGETMAAFRVALAGRADEAGRHLVRARQFAGPAARPSLVASLLGAEAAIALARGDEAAAAALFARQLGGHRVDDGRQWYGNLRRLPLLFVLVPETREQFLAAGVGPCYRPALALGQALVALRERGEVAPAAALTDADWEAATAALPTGWIVELATAAAAAGSTGAQVRVVELGSAARRTLRRLVDDADAPKAVRTWARALADAVPPEPSAPLGLAVLGPTELVRAGRPVDHPHWRRERVRALLLLLLARGGGTREELACSLWPDLDTTGALRNLRVTLSYLLAVLEPERAEGSPSYFVRAEGACLRLVTGEWLSIDARRFEAAFDEAAEAESQGEPSAALDLYREGLALYRGPYLTDAGYEEWALPHRDRLAARFVAGAVRAGELALAGGRPDEALRLAGRAVEVERWSEAAHRLTVAAHLARGDRAAARRAMQTCLRQLDDLGVPPTEDTEIVLRAVS